MILCAAPIFWTNVRTGLGVSTLFTKKFKVKLEKLRKGGDKYEYAWEGSIDVSADGSLDDDYFRAAFLEMKFPSVTGQTLPPPYNWI